MNQRPALAARLVFVALIGLAGTSCALLLPAPERTAEIGDEGISRAARPVAPAPAVSAPKESGLSAETFVHLPPEGKAYLLRLAEAFRRQDSAYLLAQGEPGFAERQNPMHDQAEYLALLYRIGPYAAENPGDPYPLPRLQPAQIRSIEYTGWEEQGPVLEIRGRILLTSSATPLPCRIMLLWRLKEQKILGHEP